MKPSCTIRRRTRRPLPSYGSLIYQTSTFEQEHADRFGDYDYSRSGNPTRADPRNDRDF